MRIIPVNSTLSVAPQPSAADIADLARQGFSLLVNNRPDGEEPGQLGAAAERRAAEAAGLAYVDLPVTGLTITRAAIAEFQRTIEQADGPVLAHCRGGTRSLTLWVLGEVLAGRMRREEILDFGAARGVDLSGALHWLDADAAAGG